MATAARIEEPRVSPALRPLLTEIGHLKRIYAAGREGSLATRLFARAWGRVAAGEAPDRVALSTTSAAVAAARLGDIDAAMLAKGGLAPAERRRVLEGAIDAVAAPLDRVLVARLKAALEVEPAGELPVPSFVPLLGAQPRAGVTCPGRARIMLEPAENHAEHSIIVGIYGVLLCPLYRADPGTVMLMALSHHLHNARMPDAGFTGEMLLGEHLEPIMARLTGLSLAELPPALRIDVEEARRRLPDADSAEGRAFHAADVIDRVLQIESHLAAATLTMDRVLGEMELVHDGPVKRFHDRVLAEIGLP